MPADGPEPSGWELMRRLDGIDETIRGLGGRVVSQDTYNADKKGIDDRFVRIEGEIDAFHTKTAERDKVEAEQRTENDRFRKNFNLTIVLVFVGPIIAGIVGYFLRAGGVA